MKRHLVALTSAAYTDTPDDKYKPPSIPLRVSDTVVSAEAHQVGNYLQLTAVIDREDDE